MSRIVNLIMVTENNNNKFYNMVENGSILDVTYGRVGNKGVKKQYDIWEWDRLYREKIAKGYYEITNLKREIKNNGDTNQIQDLGIKNLVDILITKARNNISDNYLVGFDQVTSTQLIEAQSILDSILEYKTKKVEVDELNRRLLRLYRTIPRRMNNVKDYLLTSFDTTRIKEIVMAEQELLDNLKTQVVQNNTTGENPLEKAGLQIENITQQEKLLILDKLGTNANQFRRAYKVVNKATQEIYNKNSLRKTELFWHGSRTENWWSILSNGLKIRPTGVVTCGAMFGHGIYFADKAQKSIGYTSLNSSCWAHGNDNTAYLALFEVKVGTQKNIHNHTSECYTLDYNKIKKQGYDSVYAHKGADLRNNEYIIYKEEQCTVKYIVEIGK